MKFWYIDATHRQPLPLGKIVLCACRHHPADKESYQRQIEATDWQIDTLMHELYGLSEEEIEVVEGLDHE